MKMLRCSAGAIKVCTLIAAFTLRLLAVLCRVLTRLPNGSSNRFAPHCSTCVEETKYSSPGPADAQKRYGWIASATHYLCIFCAPFLAVARPKGWRFCAPASFTGSKTAE
ncbi:hypothetical protein [uncultured Roseobacter sp.]|uniref:hypothetical protein n=1 Tax=uncultured Roseobacter sp. TaxID=114847 RepID=UPI0026072B07|nr:hypothetical protein [uncultured Roseobacter sp.]